MNDSHSYHSDPDGGVPNATRVGSLSRRYGRSLRLPCTVSTLTLRLAFVVAAVTLTTNCGSTGRIGPRGGGSSTSTQSPSPELIHRNPTGLPRKVPDTNDGETVVPPTTNLPNGVTSFNVRNYGALGDGIHNDYDAFQKALGELLSLQQRGPRELVLPDGTYYLMPPSDARAHVAIESEQGLTVRGGKYTKLLLGSAFHHGIRVNNSRNVQLESLTVDYKPLPFTQGTITEIDSATRSFVLEVDLGYPRVDEAQFQADGTTRIVYLFQAGSTILVTETHDQYIDATEVLDSRRARLTSQAPVNKSFLGLRAVMVGRRSIDAIVFDRTSDSSAKRVTVHSSPALGFGLRHTSRITVDTCSVIQAPGRLLSTNADGIHVKWGPIGPLIRNCHLEGMGDDGINIGGSYQLIHEQPDKRTLMVDRHASLSTAKAIVLVHNQTGAMEQLPEIFKVESVGNTIMRLHFAADVPRIEHLATSSEAGRADMVLNLDEVATGAVVTDNFIGRNRFRGIILHGPNALIENNRFEDMLGPAIRVGHHYRGGIEGPNGSNAIIRHNKFINVQDSPVHLSDRLADSDVNQRSIEGVEISDNQFLGYGRPSVRQSGVTGCAVFIDNAQRVELRGNVIGDPAPGAPAIPRVLLGNVADVTIRASNISPEALVDDEWLGVEAAADMASVTLER